MNLKLMAIPLAALGLMMATAGRQAASDAAVGSAPPGRLAWPLDAWIETQAYGCTPFALEPVASWCPSGHFHSGIDMAAPAGRTVRAAAAGRARVAWNPGGYGLYVILDHGGGVSTLYAHLEATSLLDGDTVAAGGEVGRVGSTGLSTGPHLHFEVRRDGRPVDPSPWLPAGHDDEVAT
jgi:murein DD-endopeptidase MepM/ murein hydrolase activator NlpD